MVSIGGFMVAKTTKPSALGGLRREPEGSGLREGKKLWPCRWPQRKNGTTYFFFLVAAFFFAGAFFFALAAIVASL
jgi:hypothetical protein